MEAQKFNMFNRSSAATAIVAALKQLEADDDEVIAFTEFDDIQPMIDNCIVRPAIKAIDAVCGCCAACCIPV